MHVARAFQIASLSQAKVYILRYVAFTGLRVACTPMRPNIRCILFLQAQRQFVCVRMWAASWCGEKHSPSKTRSTKLSPLQLLVLSAG